MLKIEPLPSRPTGTTPVGSPTGSNLPVGTLLTVEAVRDSTSAQLLLMLAGRKFALRPGGAAPDVQPGDKLTARVTRTEPELELTLVSRADEVASALRRELPQQASPLRLLANLMFLATRPAPVATGGDPAAPEQAPLARLPAAAAEAVEATVRAVPEARQLATPEGLEKAVLASGVRLERLLATPPRDLAAQVGNDWKGALLKLRDVLVKSGAQRVAAAPDTSDTPLPMRYGELNAMSADPPSLSRATPPDAALGQLVQQVQESIARVTCNQLASLDPRQQAAFPLLLEIPYRQGTQPGLLRVRVDREAHATTASPVWSVEFAVDLGASGPLRGRVTLAEGRVSVTLQPEQSSLARSLDARFEELRSSLTEAGLPVGKLSCTRSDPVNLSQTGTWLVNLRA